MTIDLKGYTSFEPCIPLLYNYIFGNQFINAVLYLYFLKNCIPPAYPFEEESDSERTKETKSPFHIPPTYHLLLTTYYLLLTFYHSPP